jgi:hypothetical protein
LLAPSSAPTIYRSVPPSDSQRSCAAAVWVWVCMSGSPAMRRPPTVESSLRPAAAIMVACAWSGSVGWDYQQNDPVAVESEDFDGVGRLESVSVESYRSSAAGEFGGCFRPVVELVQHAVNGPEPHREHREQIWKLSGLRSQSTSPRTTPRWPGITTEATKRAGSFGRSPNSGRNNLSLSNCLLSSNAGSSDARPHRRRPQRPGAALKPRSPGTDRGGQSRFPNSASMFLPAATRTSRHLPERIFRRSSMRPCLKSRLQSSPSTRPTPPGGAHRRPTIAVRRSLQTTIGNTRQPALFPVKANGSAVPNREQSYTFQLNPR